MIVTVERIFPYIMIACSIGSAIVYAVVMDWRRAAYWTAATVITLAVTL